MYLVAMDKATKSMIIRLVFIQNEMKYVSPLENLRREDYVKESLQNVEVRFVALAVFKVFSKFSKG